MVHEDGGSRNEGGLLEAVDDTWPCCGLAFSAHDEGFCPRPAQSGGSCSECGNYSSSGRYCPQDGTELGPINCERCGWEVLRHHAYCGGCGGKR